MWAGFLNTFKMKMILLKPHNGKKKGDIIAVQDDRVRDFEIRGIAERSEDALKAPKKKTSKPGPKQTK